MYIYNITIISQHVLDSISRCIKISRFLCHQQYDQNLTINIVFRQFDVQNILLSGFYSIGCTFRDYKYHLYYREVQND